jgi:hypothetical protein
MLRAYTDNEAFANRTLDDDITSPLILNGTNYTRPNNDVNAPSGYNAGVGFRYETYSMGPNDWNYGIWTIADDQSNYAFGSNFSSIGFNEYLDGQVGDGDRTDSRVIIYLNLNNELPPLDSRWVDKLTIESSATTPNTWVSNT